MENNYLSNKVTILRTANDRNKAAKGWKIGRDGKPEKDNQPIGKEFAATTHPVNNIRDLAGFIFLVENEQNLFIIRGEPNPEADFTRTVYRRSTPTTEEGLPTFFLEEPRSWVCLDIDGHKNPDLIDPAMEPEKALKFVVSSLPEQFQEVTFFGQFTGSQGFKGNVLSIHLWFWLDRPLGQEELTTWGNAINNGRKHRLIDTSIFGTIQPHFTAVPILKGLDNPLPRRSFLIEGSKETVSMPPIEITSDQDVSGSERYSGEPRDSWKRHLEKIGDGPELLGFNKPLCQAVASYVALNNIPTGGGRSSFIGDIRIAIDAAPKMASRPPEEINRYKSNRYLNDLIDSAGRKYSPKEEGFSKNDLSLSTRKKVFIAGDMEERTQTVMKEVEQAAGANDGIFLRGRQLVRVVPTREDMTIESMDSKTLSEYVGSHFMLVERERDGNDDWKEKKVDLSGRVGTNILSQPSWNLPRLEEIISCPVFNREGRLLTQAGYHPSLEAYIDLKTEVPVIPTKPTENEVKTAKNLIINDLLHDFPFADQASVANTIALALVFYVRPMIDGPVPLYMITAPKHGSGKTLLVDSLASIANGKLPASMPEGGSDDEWRKRITALLMESPNCVKIDNVNRNLDSGALASLLTTGKWSDRLLGRNETVTLYNRSIWTATGNNPFMSGEIARRVVWIRLVPKAEQPWKRTGFRHPELIPWVKKERNSLLTAMLTLIQNWVARGRPLSNITLGSFESWAKVIGGILETAEIEGFLENQDQLHDQASDEDIAWKTFVSVWFYKHKENEVTVGQNLLEIARSSLEVVLGDRSEQSQKNRLARALKKQVGRVYGDYQICSGGVGERVKVGSFRLKHLVELVE